MGYSDKQILKDLDARLKKEFGALIHRVILYGSRACGEAREFSDYDILIIVKENVDWQTEDAILEKCYEIDLEYDIVTDIKLISTHDLTTLKGKQPFIVNALEKGLTV